MSPITHTYKTERIEVDQLSNRLLHTDDPNVLLLLAASDSTGIQILEALDQGASLGAVDQEGRNALVRAAILNPDGDAARCLVSLGLSPGGTDTNGVPLLSYFARFGLCDLVKLALDEGAPVDGTEVSRGHFSFASPFLNAARGGFVDVVNLLYDRGADINVRGLSGATAFHGAPAHIIGRLVEIGCDINASDERGANALIGAVTRFEVDACSAFIAHGIDVNATNESGESAFERAIQMNNAPCLSLLLRAGAKYDPEKVASRLEGKPQLAAMIGAWTAKQALSTVRNAASKPSN